MTLFSRIHFSIVRNRDNIILLIIISLMLLTLLVVSMSVISSVKILSAFKYTVIPFFAIMLTAVVALLSYAASLLDSDMYNNDINIIDCEYEDIRMFHNIVKYLHDNNFKIDNRNVYDCFDAIEIKGVANFGTQASIFSYKSRYDNDNDRRMIKLNVGKELLDEIVCRPYNSSYCLIADILPLREDIINDFINKKEKINYCISIYDTIRDVNKKIRKIYKKETEVLDILSE